MTLAFAAMGMGSPDNRRFECSNGLMTPTA
jgi:hypothetical protein